MSLASLRTAQMLVDVRQTQRLMVFPSGLRRTKGYYTELIAACQSVYAGEVQQIAPGEITQLLSQWEKGDNGSAEQLAPLVYERLHAIAESYLRSERPDHTLQPTAIVNEIFIDLLDLRQLSLRDREHFFAFAARLARRILVDSARRSKSGKRGGKWLRIPLDAELAWATADGAESLDLSAALEELGALDPMKTRIVELHYFLGCSVQETAEMLGISKSTVERSLRFSLAWLGNRLRPAC